MSLADTAELIVLLKLSDQFTPGFKSIDRQLKGFNSNALKAQSASFKIGSGIGLGIRNAAKLAAVGVGFLGSQVALGISSLSKLEAVTTQTNTVLRSTKGAAGLSAFAIADLANKYEDLNATIDNKVIQSGENVLLTFTKVRKAAFEPALKAALDLNTALGGNEDSLQSRIILVGKALNDPVKGLTALRRVGVNVTDQMQNQIKALVKSGNLYGAQKLVIKELNTEFGGSFLGQGNTTAGKIAKVGDAVEDLQATLAETLLPTVTDVAVQLNKFLRDPATIAATRDLGKAIGGIFTGANIKNAAEFARSTLPFITDQLKTTAAIAKTAIGAFNSLPEGVKTIALAALVGNKLTGGLVASGIGDIAKNVLSSGGILGRGANPGNPVWVATAGGGLGGVAGAAGTGSKLLGFLGKASLVVAAAAVAAEIEGIAIADTQAKIKAGTLSDADLNTAAKHNYGNPLPGTGPAPVRSPFSNALSLSDAAERSSMNRTGHTLAEFSDRAQRAADGAEGFSNASHAAARALFKIRESLYHREKVALHGGSQLGALGAGSKTSVLVADALAAKFAHSQAPFYKDTKNISRTMTGLKALQAKFNATGDTKSAAHIGRDITSLKATIANQKPPQVTVNTTTNISVAGLAKASIAWSKYSRVAGNDRRHG